MYQRHPPSGRTFSRNSFPVKKFSQFAFLSLSSPRASTYTNWKRLPAPFGWIATTCCFSFVPALYTSPPFSGLSSSHSSLFEDPPLSLALAFCDGSEQFKTAPYFASAFL